MISLKSFALALTLLISVSANNEAPTELYMDSKVIKYYGKYYNSLKLYLGTGQTNEKNNMLFELSIGRSDVLVGNKDKVDWGVNCPKDSEDKNSSCQLSQVNILAFSKILFSNL